VIELIVNDKKLRFEHSLVSLSAWEQEYERPFYHPDPEKQKTDAELRRYFQHMLVGKSQKHGYLVQMLNSDQMLSLGAYISKKATATTVKEINQAQGVRENITSELIYYWLVASKIPFQPTETWHLNRLLMLVKVVSIKNAPPPKANRQNKSKLAMSMRELNEQRLAAKKTGG
jgi:hypothetical protein